VPDRVIRLAAYGIVRRDEEVLLVRASSSSDVPGTWWLPGGGVEFGEPPERTVIRELAEETGLEVAVVGQPLILTDLMSVPRRDLELFSVRLCYPVAVRGGTLRDEVDESTDHAAWLPRATAEVLPLLPFVRTALGWE
jgi:ADP-ribose pyrophosphatase YjhB (NUDIX family)